MPILTRNFINLAAELSVINSPDLTLFILFGWGGNFLSVAWPTGFNWCFSFALDFQ